MGLQELELQSTCTMPRRCQASAKRQRLHGGFWQCTGVDPKIPRPLPQLQGDILHVLDASSELEVVITPSHSLDSLDGHITHVGVIAQQQTRWSVHLCGRVRCACIGSGVVALTVEDGRSTCELVVLNIRSGQQYFALLLDSRVVWLRLGDGGFLIADDMGQIAVWS